MVFKSFGERSLFNACAHFIQKKGSTPKITLGLTCKLLIRVHIFRQINRAETSFSDHFSKYVVLRRALLAFFLGLRRHIAAEAKVNGPGDSNKSRCNTERTRRVFGEFRRRSEFKLIGLLFTKSCYYVGQSSLGRTSPRIRHWHCFVNNNVRRADKRVTFLMQV